MARGRSNGDIAREMHLSAATAHVPHILTKLGLDDRTQIARSSTAGSPAPILA